MASTVCVVILYLALRPALERANLLPKAEKKADKLSLIHISRGVDPELFPFRTWARLQKELLYSSPELLTHGDAQGDL